MKRPDEFYLASLWLRVSLWFKGLFKAKQRTPGAEVREVYVDPAILNQTAAQVMANPPVFPELIHEPTEEFIAQGVQEILDLTPVAEQIAEYKEELKAIGEGPNREPAWPGSQDTVPLPVAAQHGAMNRIPGGPREDWLSPYITPRGDFNLNPGDYRIPWPEHPLAGFKLTGTMDELAAGLQDHDSQGNRNQYDY